MCVKESLCAAEPWKEVHFRVLFHVLKRDWEDIRRSARSTLMMKTLLPNILSMLPFASFTATHDIPGVVTMLNAGVHRNNSLFAISLKPLPHLGFLFLLTSLTIQMEETWWWDMSWRGWTRSSRCQRSTAIRECRSILWWLRIAEWSTPSGFCSFMECLFKKCLFCLAPMNKSPNITFLSQWDYMNPSYRSSMEDVSIVNYTLRENRNISLIALPDGHGGA